MREGNTPASESRGDINASRGDVEGESSESALLSRLGCVGILALIHAIVIQAQGVGKTVPHVRLNSMNVPISLRVPALPGIAVSVLLAVISLGVIELRGAQLTFGESDPLLPLPPKMLRTDTPWPAVEWGLHVTFAEPFLPMESLSGQEIISPPPDHPSQSLLPVASSPARDVVPPSVAKGEPIPPLSEIAASPTDEKEPSSESKTPAPKWSAQHLGDGSFNQAAESLNVHKVAGGRNSNDLSRQFEGATASRNVATASPITGWAILILIALVAFGAIALGQYESDDDLKRRKESRHRRRSHRHSE